MADEATAAALQEFLQQETGSVADKVRDWCKDQAASLERDRATFAAEQAAARDGNAAVGLARPRVAVAALVTQLAVLDLSFAAAGVAPPAGTGITGEARGLERFDVAFSEPRRLDARFARAVGVLLRWR